VLDNPPSVLGNGAIEKLIVALEQLAPGTVAELGLTPESG
jgi:hypothetical protein